MKRFISILLAATAALSIATAANAHDHGDKDKMKDKMKKEMHPSIVNIAANNPDFSTLIAALKAADLVSALEGDGPFTVFAPTNAAFDKLPKGTVESLLKPENKQKLVDILTYHVVAGAVYAKDVVTLDSATTLQGTDVTISTNMGTVKVNDATVVMTDIKGSNGVIHVIDTVIMPK
ncbi:fasciclin domain-containing protein [Alteromonas oceanisediminis]|uniref:fasciclin domain-containing protein n=1 Tax=Alteromonas oceanisediminis TaxID=2836180 RepID=UPI001BD91BD0|nr:fasciclin domain-containing protein [Alteromonas oceanisediminis]MBT0585929.1 fasciclin domain-containing protein [Alteromonas oceanisediminis]